MKLTRRKALTVLGTAASTIGLGSAAADPPDSDSDDEDDDQEFPESGWSPGGSVDADELTDKNRGQLVASIPNDAKDDIEDADLFTPLNALEAQQNNDQPTEDEGGLVTFEETDGGLEYTFQVNDAENGDLDDLTQGHIHHAPPGESDNRLFVPLFIRSDLDGSDGDPEDPSLSVSKTLTEAVKDGIEFGGDNVFRQNDPGVPFVDTDFDEDTDEETIAEFVEALAEAMLDDPREYIDNAHTVEFQTEAIRATIRPADFGQLSREELIETVLATGGLEALEGGPPGRPNKEDKEDKDDKKDKEDEEDEEDEADEDDADAESDD